MIIRSSYCVETDFRPLNPFNPLPKSVDSYPTTAISTDGRISAQTAST